MKELWNHFTEKTTVLQWSALQCRRSNILWIQDTIFET